MVVYRDSAVVLRVGKLGEADRIVTLLSRRSGLIRAVAKGIRRTKSRFGGRLEPFNHVDVQLYSGRSLDTVTQAVTLDPFGAKIASDYARYTAATVIVETADRLAAEERQPWLRLYLLVVSALRALCEPPSARPGLHGLQPGQREGLQGSPNSPLGLPDAQSSRQDATTDLVRDPSLVMDAFLLRAMALAGWAPALDDCARCGAPGPHAAFHIPSGGVLCSDCRSGGFARPAPATLILMEALAAGDWSASEASAPEHRREASGLIAALVQFHLERGLRSLPLVDRVVGMTTFPAMHSAVELFTVPDGVGHETAPARAATGGRAQ